MIELSLYWIAQNFNGLCEAGTIDNYVAGFVTNLPNNIDFEIIRPIEAYSKRVTLLHSHVALSTSLVNW